MRQKKHLMSLALLVFFFVWQTQTLLHLLLTSHTVCEHGRVVDADPESGRPHHDPEDQNNPNHKGCRIVALLTSAEIRMGDAPPTCALVHAVENNTCILRDRIVTIYGSELFRLSPSHSPPMNA